MWKVQKYKISSRKKLRVDGEGISFVKLPDFKGPEEMLTKSLIIKKIIKTAISKSDAVLLRAPSPTSYLALNTVKKSKKPFGVEMVANPRTALEIHENKNLIKKLKNELIKKVWVLHAKEVCKSANGVSYVTERALQNEYPCHSILFGESKKFFNDSYSTINLKQSDFTYEEENKKKNENEYFTICHTGYMDGKTKGHLTVIKTLKILLNRGYKVKVKFIGSGKYMPEFEEYANKLDLRENVEFLGGLFGYKEVQKVLRASDLYFFPTMSEGLPRSLIEAMANKLPCISSPVDGIPELLEGEFLAPYNSTESYANKIEELINSPQLREEAAEKNYIKAKEYTQQKLTPRRDRFYSKLYSLTQE
ncbi:glycosyl transferase, group 1 [Planococcus halocryophilus Or1]|uniref:glycosyltransferase family 4 protein n=1 Tax=Planococcus halocryophilus TaxID=1215089 RepID=UPI0002B89343|nr:glycosyltransferase [Planococcus halocryophilus]EMF47442.1 glycosyl transferase, group 1 [Planococcus halocryophilus Or1]